MEQLTDAILHQVITPRPADSHKGNYGRCVLIGGARQYGGAILMAAEACVQAGAGLTTVVTAKESHGPLHTRRPEAMAVDWLDFALTESVIETADILLIGPGLGDSERVRKLLAFVLQKRQPDQWLVIDGSAITILAEAAGGNLIKLRQLLGFPETVVFTPHQMEWQRLSGIPITQQTSRATKAFTKELGTTVIAKSHRTTIFAADGFCARNPHGTPAMATGGTGDTLAGIITAFLAQFPKNGKTIAAAVYLHSLIADDLAESRYVVLPTEISGALPLWMKHFEYD